MTEFPATINALIEAQKAGDASAYADALIEGWTYEGAMMYVDLWAEGKLPITHAREGFWDDVGACVRLYKASDEPAEPNDDADAGSHYAFSQESPDSEGE